MDEYRQCPWCESWSTKEEPRHTDRCWFLQQRHHYDPWGDINPNYYWDV